MDVGHILIRAGSHGRLGWMLTLLAHEPPAAFWPVFMEWWDCCDATWPWREELLFHLRRRHAVAPGPEYLQGDARAFFDRLPDQIEVFRGCSRPRVRGVAWTTAREVAAGFAMGIAASPSPIRWSPGPRSPRSTSLRRSPNVTRARSCSTRDDCAAWWWGRCR
jgi:hypothetical protein